MTTNRSKAKSTLRTIVNMGIGAGIAAFIMTNGDCNGSGSELEQTVQVAQSPQDCSEVCAQQDDTVVCQTSYQGPSAQDIGAAVITELDNSDYACLADNCRVPTFDECNDIYGDEMRQGLIDPNTCPPGETVYLQNTCADPRDEGFILPNECPPSQDHAYITGDCWDLVQESPEEYCPQTICAGYIRRDN